ncbi:MAG: SDR family NAD(P)-dependent oxidoreductase [Actinobacteria bacterium]|nr:MAG: SDR family NAD(P)-dependent oxidoreductase [Actinomycetota bacterium]
MPETAFVTGGTGFVGGAIVERLVSAGRAVKALARSDDGAHTLRALGAEPVHGDVLDARTLVDAMRGCGVLYHAAGVNAFCLGDTSPLFEVNVRGSVNAVHAAADAGVRRIVYTSSAATLGEVVSVNPASVQGPGRATGTARLLLDYLNGRLKVVVDSTISLIDVADCTEGHVRAEARGKPGERYVLSGATISVRDGIRLLERLTGIERKVRSLPPGLALAAALAVETSARFRRRSPPVCRELVRTALHGHAYDGSRAARELGLRYTPVEETVRRTIDWFRGQGLVPTAV